VAAASTLDDGAHSSSREALVLVHSFRFPLLGIINDGGI